MVIDYLCKQNYIWMAENKLVQEDACDVQLLLGAKGDRPLLHILLLLCDSASLCFGASSERPQMGSHLPSLHHYHSQLRWNSEVVPSAVLLGAVRERDVVPPHQGDGDRAVGGEDSERVGGDGEAG